VGSFVGVAGARAVEYPEFAIGELEDFASEGSCELGRTLAVIGVVAFVLAPAIVQDGEELDDFDPGAGFIRQSKAVFENPGPVGDSVFAVPGKGVIGEDGADYETQVQWHGRAAFARSPWRITQS
jgi:hypothetical protein